MSSPRHLQPPPRAASARRHRLRVRVLRVVLPALALGCVGLAFFWPTLMPQDDRLRVGIDVQRDSVSGEKDAMIGASYSGIDGEGRPFTVTAARIRRETPDSPVMLLSQPEATLSIGEGDIASLRAANGIYDRAREVIDLEGDVRLERIGRLQANTSRAAIAIAAGRAEGSEAVEASGPFGTVRGVGFVVERKGAVITVGGPAKLVLAQPETVQP